jgi:hypothetical protein
MGYDAGRFLTPSRSAVALDSLLQPEIPVGTVMLSIVCFYLSSLTARAQFVEHHGQDDDCALDNQLPVKGDVHPGDFFISSRKACHPVGPRAHGWSIHNHDLSLALEAIGHIFAV